MEIHFVENWIQYGFWIGEAHFFQLIFKFDEISGDLLVLRWRSDSFEVLETRWYKAALWIDIPIKLQFLFLVTTLSILKPQMLSTFQSMTRNSWNGSTLDRWFLTVPHPSFVSKSLARLTTLHDFKPLQFLQVSSSRSGRVRVPNQSYPNFESPDLF